ncbi:hypothetical protein AB1Y20_008020 [Prymnesium parvum]|uniref:RING-type domain-containing protein n=1 Tax=Prymnesium parvum TaxID=97485 RepID=A0AB34IVP5_PRYPA
MEVVIELSSDDEQPARSRNTRKEQRAPPADGPQEVILDSDHEDCGGDIHGDGSSGSANDGRLGSTSQEKQSSIDVVDLYAASSSAVACGICAKEPPAFPFTLAVCRHRFCHECISRHVNGKLTEALGHEVGCPECSSQLTMNELHVLTNSASLGPDATRPSKKARGSAVGTLAATKRLMRELQAIERGDPNDRGFAVSLSDESDLYTWDIEFFNFEGGSPLAKDLSKVPGNKILLRAAFPRTAVNIASEFNFAFVSANKATHTRQALSTEAPF